MKLDLIRAPQPTAPTGFIHRMFGLIPLALSKPRLPDAPDVSVCAADLVDIVSSRSHGNVRLQQGRFYTQKDVDAQFAELREEDFAD